MERVRDEGEGETSGELTRLGDEGEGETSDELTTMGETSAGDIKFKMVYIIERITTRL